MVDRQRSSGQLRPAADLHQHVQAQHDTLPFLGQPTHHCPGSITRRPFSCVSQSSTAYVLKGQGNK